MMVHAPLARSDQGLPLTQEGDRFRQFLGNQCVEIFLDRLRRVPQASTMLRHGGEDGWFVKVEQVAHKGVWVLGLDTKRGKSFGGEVVQVFGYDQIGTRGDRSSKYMAVIRIGEIKGFDERLVANDQAVLNVCIHHRARAREIRLQLGTLAKNCPDPFVMNLIRPLGPIQIGKGEPHEQVPQRSGIQHTSVIQRCESHHCSTVRSVAQPEFLGLLGEFIENSPARLIFLLFIGHQIIVENSAVGPDFPEGQFSFFEQADEERAGDVQEVCRLLGGQLGMNGGDRHGVAGRHLSQDVEQQTDRSRRQDEGCLFPLPFLMGFEPHPLVVAGQTRERPARLACQQGFGLIWLNCLGETSGQRTWQRLLSGES